MTQVVYLHVGAPKSGTTYLQQVLEHNRRGWPAPACWWWGPHLDLIHAAMVVRGTSASPTSPRRRATRGTGWSRRSREWPGTRR